MTLKLATISPNLTSTQVSEWTTRQTSQINKPSGELPSQGNDFYLLFTRVTGGGLSTGVGWNNESLFKSGNIYTMGSYYDVPTGDIGMEYTQFIPATKTLSSNNYRETGMYIVELSGYVGNSYLFFVARDNDSTKGLYWVRVDLSTGAVGASKKTGSVSYAHSSLKIVKDQSDNDTILLSYAYNTSPYATYQSYYWRLDSSGTGSTARRYDFGTGASGTFQYGGTYVVNATRIIFVGTLGAGNRFMIGMDNTNSTTGSCTFFEYGNSDGSDVVSYSSSSNDVFVVGQTNSAAGVYAAFISKHNATNFTSVAPTTRIAYVDSNNSCLFRSVVADSTNGFVYAVGNRDVQYSATRGILFKYNASTMALEWQREILLPGFSPYLTSVTLDADNNPIIGGTVDNQPILIHINKNGGVLETQTVKSALNPEWEFSFTLQAGTLTSASATTTINTGANNTLNYQTSAGISFGTATSITKQTERTWQSVSKFYGE